MFYLVFSNVFYHIIHLNTHTRFILRVVYTKDVKYGKTYKNHLVKRIMLR